MRRFLLIVPLIAVLAGAGVALFRSGPASIGRAAPEFSLPDLEDPEQTISLRDLRGKPVVANFWASWCDPCRDEAPELARTARELGRDVTFLGVNILDGRREARAYVARYSLPYASVRDARGTVAKRYRVTGAPETFFIDGDGRLVGKYIGAFTQGQLGRLVRDLVALRPGETLLISGSGETRPVP